MMSDRTIQSWTVAAHRVLLKGRMEGGGHFRVRGAPSTPMHNSPRPLCEVPVLEPVLLKQDGQWDMRAKVTGFMHGGEATGCRETGCLSRMGQVGPPLQRGPQALGTTPATL